MSKNLLLALRAHNLLPQLTTPSAAPAWSLYVKGIRYLLHYLDDFLFIGPLESNEAAMVLDRAISTFRDLGAPVAMHKNEGPATLLPFLGILIDTVMCQLRLPQDKLQRLRDLVCIHGSPEGLVGEGRWNLCSVIFRTLHWSFALAISTFASYLHYCHSPQIPIII